MRCRFSVRELARQQSKELPPLEFDVLASSLKQIGVHRVHRVAVHRERGEQLVLRFEAEAPGGHHELDRFV